MRSSNKAYTTRKQTITKSAPQKYSPTFTIRDNYSSAQRDKILSKNAEKNDGFYTCENGNCGFQHRQKTYATKKGRRMGDGSFHIDHKDVPASQGGKASLKNSAVLCGTCNTSKGNRANSGITGKQKYSALHRKSLAKDYKNAPRKVH